MAKIFISFFNAINDHNNVQAMPCFYESFLNEIKNVGNEVFCYYKNQFQDNDFSGPPPVDVLKQIKDFNPDLIILFNNMFYDVSEYFDCPIIIYEVDSVLYYINKDNIKKNIDRYKFLVPQSDSIKVINETLGVPKKNICYAPFFTSVKAEEIEQNKNISFIGSKFINSFDYIHLNKFMKSIPDAQEIEEFKSVLNTIKNEPFLSEEELITKLNLKSKKVIDNISVHFLIFIISDVQRIQTLSQIADLGLHLYGSSNWMDIANDLELLLSFNNESVYSLRHNQDIYNSSKLCLNVNHIQATTGFSWRVCDIMASNGCLVSEYKSDFEKLFPNIEIPVFTNRYEARELCIKLLKNDNMRKDIVFECQQIIDEKYRFKHLLKRMEDFLEITLHSELKNKENTNLILQKIPSTKANKANNHWSLIFYSALFSLSLMPVFNKIFKSKKILQKINKKLVLS